MRTPNIGLTGSYQFCLRLAVWTWILCRLAEWLHLGTLIVWWKHNQNYNNNNKMDNKVGEQQAYFCHFSYISMSRRCDTPLHSMLRDRNFTESTLCFINIFVMVDAQVYPLFVSHFLQAKAMKHRWMNPNWIKHSVRWMNDRQNVCTQLFFNF